MGWDEFVAFDDRRNEVDLAFKDSLSLSTPEHSEVRGQEWMARITVRSVGAGHEPSIHPLERSLSRVACGRAESAGIRGVAAACYLSLFAQPFDISDAGRAVTATLNSSLARGSAQRARRWRVAAALSDSGIER